MCRAEAGVSGVVTIAGALFNGPVVASLLAELQGAKISVLTHVDH